MAKEISIILEESESGERVGVYIYMKNEPVPEICVTSNNSAEARSVVSGLRLGCMQIAVEVGRYTGTPYIERVYWLYGTGEMEDPYYTSSSLLPHCHVSDRNYSCFVNTILRSFSREPSSIECKFILSIRRHSNVSYIPNVPV